MVGRSSLSLLMVVLLIVDRADSVNAAKAKIRTPVTATGREPAPASWQRQACDAKDDGQAAGHFTCTDDHQLRCEEGWTGDLCQVPMCKKGCHPLNGYCTQPGECRCRLGFAGELCDTCALLPGCIHGTCNKSFECLCKPGWRGLFCTQAICKEGCHKTRGYCEAPNDCRCRFGWTGANCTDCLAVSGCRNGYCQKPLDCLCRTGWTGLLCQNPICKKGCSKEHGYCQAPNQCRCRVGWWGEFCDLCHPYPGCQHGYCVQPWQCQCRPGWTGFLCNQSIASCGDDGSFRCLNGGTCYVERDAADPEDGGRTACRCPVGYNGPRCASSQQTDTAPSLPSISGTVAFGVNGSANTTSLPAVHGGDASDASLSEPGFQLGSSA